MILLMAVANSFAATDNGCELAGANVAANEIIEKYGQEIFTKGLLREAKDLPFGLPRQEVKIQLANGEGLEGLIIGVKEGRMVISVQGGGYQSIPLDAAINSVSGRSLAKVRIANKVDPTKNEQNISVIIEHQLIDFKKINNPFNELAPGKKVRIEEYMVDISENGTKRARDLKAGARDVEGEVISSGDGKLIIKKEDGAVVTFDQSRCDITKVNELFEKQTVKNPRFNDLSSIPNNTEISLTDINGNVINGKMVRPSLVQKTDAIMASRIDVQKELLFIQDSAGEVKGYSFDGLKSLETVVHKGKESVEIFSE